MLAKQIAILSLLGLLATTSVLAQGLNRSPPKPSPKNTVPAGTNTTAKDRTEATEQTPTPKNVQQDKLKCTAITDARGVKRVIAETTGKDGKNEVALFINGLGIIHQRDKAGSDHWTVFTKTGSRLAAYSGEIELVGDRDIRITPAYSNQVRIIKSSGDWEWRLASAGAVRSVATPLPPARLNYTIRSKGESGREVVDHRDGCTYSTDAFCPQDKLTSDSKTGDLTFIDRRNFKVTLRNIDEPDIATNTLSGSRVMHSRKGLGVGYETDFGGRLIRWFDEQGKTTREYGYRLTNGRAVQPGRFRNQDNDEVSETRIDDIYQLRIQRTDGSTITETAKRLPDGLGERTVNVGNGEVETAYSVAETRTADGTLVNKVLSSKAGLFKTTDGMIWNQYGKDGQVIPETTWFGDVEIIAHSTQRRGVYLPSGTIVRTSYATRTEPAQPEPKLNSTSQAKETLLLDDAAQPVFAKLEATETNGWTRQKLASGALIVRYPNGNILYTVDAAGRRNAFYYEFELEDNQGERTLTGLEMTDTVTGCKIGQWRRISNTRKDDGKSSGYFLNPVGDLSFSKIRVADSGELTIEVENEFRQKLRITQLLDGTKQTETYDGDTFARDARGHVVHVRLADGLACTFERDGDTAEIIRADLPTTTFVTDGYQVSDSRPFREGVSRVTTKSLTLEDATFSVTDDDESRQFWLRYRLVRDGQEYLVRRRWPSGAETEHAIVVGDARLIRVRDDNLHEISIQYDQRGRVARADGTSLDFVGTTDEQGRWKSKSERRHRFTVITSEYRDAQGQRPAEARVANSTLTIATSHEDGDWVSYDDSSGVRVTVWANGAEEHLVKGQLRYTRDPQGRETRLTYDEQGRLSSVASSDLELKRGADGDVLLTRGADGTNASTPLAGFSVIEVGQRHAVKVIPQQGPVVVDYLLLAQGQVESRLRDGHVRRYERHTGQTTWRGRITNEIDPESNSFVYLHYGDNRSTRVGTTDGTRQDIDARGRVTYEETSEGEERYITFGDNQSRRETSLNGRVRQYDDSGRILYERTPEGDEREHFYLDKGEHVIRETLSGETRQNEEGAKVRSITTFRPHPTDKFQERMIYHQTREGRECFVNYKDEDQGRGKRRDELVAMYIVGNEKKSEGLSVDSLVEFDKHGRMIYRRQADGVAATLYYVYPADDNVPLVVKDSMGKWTRGERLWDGSRNYRWKLEKNGQTTTRTGIFEVSRFRPESPFKTTSEPRCEFVLLPRKKSLLEDGQQRRDLGNGVAVVRRQNGADIFEIQQTPNELIRLTEAAANAKLPPGVRAVDTIDVASDGSLEIRNHDGHIDRRSRAGRTLRFDTGGSPVSVSTPGGITFTTLADGKGTRADAIQVDKDGVVKVVAANGKRWTRIDKSGNLLQYVGGGDRDSTLVAVIGAKAMSSLNLTSDDSGDSLREIQWVTRLPSGRERAVSFRPDANGQWTDGESTYDAAWVDTSTGEFHVLNDLTWRTIEPDGTEEEVHYNSALWLPEGFYSPAKRRTTLKRDSTGQTTGSTGGLASVTTFVRDRQQRIVAVLEGDIALVKQADGTWKHSLHEGEKVHAKLEVTRDATQRWIGQHGVTRTVERNGTVHIARPDGSSSTFSPGGLQVLHRHGPKSLVQEVVTHTDGLITAKMKDGTRYAYNPNVRSGKVARSSGESEESLFSGAINVSEDGSVLITSFPTPSRGAEQGSDEGTASQIHPLGTVAKVCPRNTPAVDFTWRKAPTGIFWVNDRGLQLTDLQQVGAPNPRQTIAGVDAMRLGIVDESIGRGLQEISLIAAPQMAARLGVSHAWLLDQVEAGKLSTTKDGSDYYFAPASVYDMLVRRITTPHRESETLVRIEPIELAEITRLSGPLLKPLGSISNSGPSKPVGFAGSRWQIYRNKIPVGVVTLKADGTADAQPPTIKKSWKSPDGKTITIEYDHAFFGMTFKGKMVDANTLQGEAQDRQGKTWNWTAKRLPEGNQGE